MSGYVSVPRYIAVAESPEGALIRRGRFSHLCLPEHEGVLEGRINIAIGKTECVVESLGWRHEGLVLNFPSEDDLFHFKLAFVD